MHVASASNPLAPQSAQTTSPFGSYFARNGTNGPPVFKRKRPKRPSPARPPAINEFPEPSTASPGRSTWAAPPTLLAHNRLPALSNFNRKPFWLLVVVKVLVPNVATPLVVPARKTLPAMSQ